MEPALIKARLDVLLHEKRQLQHQPQSSIITPIQSSWQQIAVLWRQGSVARGMADCRARYNLRAPLRAEMVLGGVKDGDEDTDDALGFSAVGQR